MTTLKFKTGVRCDGIRYAKGQVKSGFSDKEVSLFVKENVAFVVGVPDSPTNQVDNSTNDEMLDDTPKINDKEEIYREIDENWTADELKIDAERIGVDFDKKILKKDLIKLIVEKDYTDELLGMLEDETEE
ncbi:hypothetical protein K7T73_12965 [Bacillus badius]|uniref:hypothetical protein n=1 Tax=Bacillus badius TaxID=1455 RepID=UPI001CBD4B4B|nr:hypothetical protein [Bacillus badius]UAT29511.1 hypothetical protein K7T73_12965 [Bacillus badius]